MAKRPLFLSSPCSGRHVQIVQVEFSWVAGLALSQKQKCIDSLHQAARTQAKVGRILEISSKSRDALGVALSAFNLSMPAGSRTVCVEVAFQSSKRFTGGGPYLDILDKTSREAKGDKRLRESGRLLEFIWQGEPWALQPTTAFYDWLYLNALRANPQLLDDMLTYEAFTDIEFNPERSLNCQARSAALAHALHKTGVFLDALRSKDAFLQACKEKRNDLFG